MPNLTRRALLVTLIGAPLVTRLLDGGVRGLPMSKGHRKAILDDGSPWDEVLALFRQAGIVLTPEQLEAELNCAIAAVVPPYCVRSNSGLLAEQY